MSQKERKLSLSDFSTKLLLNHLVFKSRAIIYKSKYHLLSQMQRLVANDAIYLPLARITKDRTIVFCWQEMVI